MANWWDSAPLADGGGDDWWKTAPLAKQETYEQAVSSPEGQKLAGELRNKADRMLLEHAGTEAQSPGYAFLSSAANTLGLNIPRNVAAAARTLKPGAGSFTHEYNYLRDIDEAAARQSPWASGAGTAAGLVGSVAALPVAPAASLAGRVGQGAAIGGGMAGTAELADSKDLRSAGEAALGGLVLGGVAAPAASAAAKVVNKVARPFMRQPVAPTTEELKSAANAAYDAADAAGVIVNREGIRGVRNELRAALANEAYHPKNQPKLTNFISELDNLSVARAVPGEAPNIGVTLRGLDKTRKMLQAARLSQDAEERRLAGIAVDKFDDYLSSLSPKEIAAGDKSAGISALKEARSLWSSFRKADMIDEALQRAELKAGASGSGGNIENAIRTELKSILMNRKKSAAFTDREKAELAKVIKGQSGQNTLRLLGKLSPQGNGLMMSMHLIGGAASGGTSLPLAALGAGAKALADRGSKASIEKLGKLIRARGMNIDPASIVEEAGRDRLRNFLSSIGIRVTDLAGDVEQISRGIAGQAPARADDGQPQVIYPMGQQ